jgi:CSLREA domain-containing protein
MSTSRVLIFLLVWLSVAVAPATAQGILTVNSTGDAPDDSLGNGTCRTSSGQCTLRAAIQEANANAATSTIRFSIPDSVPGCNSGTGICTIAPDTALPPITTTIKIEGDTQPGASCGTRSVSDTSDSGWPSRTLKIELDGSSAGTTTGLSLEPGAAGSLVRGLVINRFANYGIRMVSVDSIAIACNNIGTNPAATSALGNGAGGILASSVTASSIRIGTNGDGVSDGSEGNIISGNLGEGYDGSAAPFRSGIRFSGNYVGLNATGTGTIPNSSDGVRVSGHRFSIIGTDGNGVSDELESNVIGGNAVGIRVNDGNDRLRVAGNRVGTDFTGTLNFGNTGDGILGSGTDGLQVIVGKNFDASSGERYEPNLVAFNGGAGVRVPSQTRFSIRENRIYSNIGLGIDLGSQGTTANDVSDFDVGANFLQNFPVVAAATYNGVELRATFYVDSDTAASSYPLLVEFFLADSDSEEGQEHLSTRIYTETSWASCGSEPCLVTLTDSAQIRIGDIIVATATDDLGNTSEFSKPIVVMPPGFTINSTGDDGDSVSGDGTCYTGNLNSQGVPECTLRAALEAANLGSSLDTLRFDIPLSDVGCTGGTCSIQPDTALPSIANPVFLDGTSQPGASCGGFADHSLTIELNGSNANPSDRGLGLSASASGSVVRGLAINEFGNYGITIFGLDGGWITCNNIGTDVGGTQDLGNGSGGILAFTASGGVTIGTDGDGQGDSLEGNLIAFNGGDGVTVIDPSAFPSTRIRIRQNAIRSNDGLGIDLDNDGVTLNDTLDSDTGPNNLQNYPVLTSAGSSSGTLAVSLSFSVDTASARYPLDVDFYSADPSGEGRRFVFSDDISKSTWLGCASQICSTSFFTSEAHVIGDTLVATITDALGNTSEFSAPLEITGGACTTELFVKAFLEGPYNTATDMMSTSLVTSGFVPTQQPFSGSEYSGTTLEFNDPISVAAVPDSVVDWVLVSLRNGTSAGTEVEEVAAFISKNGIVSSPGQTALCLQSGDGPAVSAKNTVAASTLTSAAYLVLRSRNHLDVMSDSAVSLFGGFGSHDFSASVGAAFGASPQLELESGVWGLFAADGTLDGQVTANDFNLWLIDTKAVKTGYLLSDYNMDGQVTANDFNLWLTNTKDVAASGVP